MVTRFLTREEVLEIHRDLLADHGGSAGIRDPGLLDSALAMPTAGFAGEYLHADVFEMAAAYLYHITKNHPFIDGNKRVGLAAALAFLDVNGHPWLASDDELVALTLRVAEGVADKSAVASFFRSSCREE